MLKTTKKGFTIIEVVIVLVIGAVIMLGVFLVVPGLQRSAQNTRRQDIARQILAATEQYKANNQGDFPPANTDITALIDTNALNDPNGTTTGITFGSTNPGTIAKAVVGENLECVGQTFGGTDKPGKVAVVIATAGTGTDVTTYCVSN